MFLSLVMFLQSFLHASPVKIISTSQTPLSNHHLPLMTVAPVKMNARKLGTHVPTYIRIKHTSFWRLQINFMFPCHGFIVALLLSTGSQLFTDQLLFCHCFGLNGTTRIEMIYRTLSNHDRRLFSGALHYIAFHCLYSSLCCWRERYKISLKRSSANSCCVQKIIQIHRKRRRFPKMPTNKKVL